MPKSTSIKTGTKLLKSIGFKVVGKVHAGVITSSPLTSFFGKVLAHSADIARRLAEDPEFVNKIWAL